MMKTTLFKIAVILALAGALTASAQQRPLPDDQYPIPPSNHVEVRFSMGKAEVACKRFKLIVKSGDRTIVSGSFPSSFLIPPDAMNSPTFLDITLQCGERKWHFPEVLPQAFRQGWWLMGTDRPPFEGLLQNNESLKDALWVKYFIVEPIGGEPFFYTYKFCPAGLKNQKPGACYTD
jgi:hypothetical protein